MHSPIKIPKPDIGFSLRDITTLSHELYLNILFDDRFLEAMIGRGKLDTNHTLKPKNGLVFRNFCFLEASSKPQKKNVPGFC